MKHLRGMAGVPPDPTVVARRPGIRAVTLRGLLALYFLCAGALAGCADAEQNVATTPANEPSTSSNGPTTVNPVDATAQEVATGFLEAYGAFDTDKAKTYLAKDADVSELIGSVGSPGTTGTLDQFPLLVSLLEAEGYQQMLRSCEEQGSSTSGTNVRCTFDFHLLGSDEIGLGPYSGSFFELTVRDGEIVQASKTWEIAAFSPEMWEPFRSWVRTVHPADFDVMYTGAGTGAALAEESIRLWEQYRLEYVEEVGRSASGAETSP